MPSADDVRERILESLPGSVVDVVDTTGGGDHFQASVVWSGFEGLGRVQQHQAVYAAVAEQLADGSIHALSIHTAVPGAHARRLPMTDIADQAGILDRDALAAEVAKKISDTPVLLFMKGTPDQPYCGFSARTVQALDAVGASFVGVNVLVDPRIREVLSEQSNWPTIPQLFVDGTLVGGCDIVTEMAQTGELAELIQNASR